MTANGDDTAREDWPMGKILFWLAIGACGCWLPERAPGQQMVVIANPGVHAASMSVDEVRDVFGGAQTRLRGGPTVTPVLLKSGPEHDSFLKEWIGKVDSSFRANWRALVFAGQAAMPKNVDDDAAMVSWVAKTPGTIGYISRNAPHEGVSTIMVAGNKVR